MISTNVAAVAICTFLLAGKSSGVKVCDFVATGQNRTDPLYYECPNYHYCCGVNNCCEYYTYYGYTPFWTFWYFWLILCLGLLFCCGGAGGYWYNNREVIVIEEPVEPPIVAYQRVSGEDPAHNLPGETTVKMVNMERRTTPGAG